METLQKISCTKDQNNKFKNATISMFDAYSDLYVNCWPLILEEMDKVSSQGDDYEVTESSIKLEETYFENISKLDMAENAFLEAQEAFARENGLKIDSEEHPLSKEFEDIAN